MLKPQYVTRFLGFLLASSVLALALAAPAFAQAPAPGAAQEDKITVNFVNADIQSVIKTVGQHTGKNFILDLPAGRYRVDAGRRMRTLRSILKHQQIMALVEDGSLAIE